MKKKDAYSLGVASAMLKKQYKLDDIIVVSWAWGDPALNTAFYQGWNSVWGKDNVNYWNLEFPEEDGVYLVQDEIYGEGDFKPRWARYDWKMGWTKSTQFKDDLDRPTLPFVDNNWPWRKG